MTQQKPSVGRVVLVPMDPDGNNGSDVAPAVITRAWNDSLINVKVLGDNAVAAEWRTSVTLHAERPANPQHDAWWPPRV